MKWPASFHTHHREIARWMEDDNSQVVCGPHGHITFSTRCADSPEGLAFTRALVRAAVTAHKQDRDALPQKQSTPVQTHRSVSQ